MDEDDDFDIHGGGMPESDLGKGFMIGLFIAFGLVIVAICVMFLLIFWKFAPWLYPVVAVLWGIGYFIQKKWKPL